MRNFQRYYSLASSKSNGNGNSASQSNGNQGPNENANQQAKDNYTARTAVTVRDFAMEVAQAVMGWWNLDGRDIFMAAGTSAQNWVNNNSYKVVPFIQAEMNWIQGVMANPEEAEVLVGIYADLMEMITELSYGNQVAQSTRNAQIAYYLSVIPFMQLNSANYLDFDWSSVNWSGIMEASEEYNDTNADLFEEFFENYMELANDEEVQALLYSYYMLPEVQQAAMFLSQATFPVLRQGAMMYAFQTYYSIIGNSGLQHIAADLQTIYTNIAYKIAMSDNVLGSGDHDYIYY